MPKVPAIVGKFQAHTARIAARLEPLARMSPEARSNITTGAIAVLLLAVGAVIGTGLAWVLIAVALTVLVIFALAARLFPQDGAPAQASSIRRVGIPDIVSGAEGLASVIARLDNTAPAFDGSDATRELSDGAETTYNEQLRAFLYQFARYLGAVHAHQHDPATTREQAAKITGPNREVYGALGAPQLEGLDDATGPNKRVSAMYANELAEASAINDGVRVRVIWPGEFRNLYESNPPYLEPFKELLLHLGPGTKRRLRLERIREALEGLVNELGGDVQ